MAAQFLLDGHWWISDLPLCRNPWPEEQVQSEASASAAAASPAIPSSGHRSESRSVDSSDGGTKEWHNEDFNSLHGSGTDHHAAYNALLQWHPPATQGAALAWLRGAAIVAELSDAGSSEDSAASGVDWGNDLCHSECVVWAII